MLHQFYISTTALSAFQRVMMNVSNNIANAQTVGFKKSRVELESLFSGIMEQAMAEFEDLGFDPNSSNKTKKIDYGMGVKIADIRKDFNQGQIQVTNRPLDCAIQGNGFFQIKLSDGTNAYTRAGNFQKNTEGYLVDPNGNMVSPAIKIPDTATSVIIDSQGLVYVNENNDTQVKEVGQLTLASFENPAGLQSIGQNLYVETAASGEANIGAPGKGVLGSIAQNSLEFSNVNVVDELMKMVVTQRSFELASKAIQSGEQMLRAAEDIAKGG